MGLWKDFNDVDHLLWKDTKERNLYRKYSRAKYRAKKKGIPFNVEAFDVEWPDVCPVLGIKLDYNRTKIADDCPSLDRIDNTKGYTLDNVWVISYRANRLKSDATPGELMKVALAVKKKLTRQEKCATL